MNVLLDEVSDGMYGDGGGRVGSRGPVMESGDHRN